MSSSMAGTYSTTLATAGGTGSHPFDAALADSRLLAWGRPVLALVARRWQVLLVGALAIAAVDRLTKANEALERNPSEALLLEALLLDLPPLA